MTNIPSPSEILQSLIRFDTTNPPGHETKCIEYIGGLLQSVGIDYQIFTKDESRPNLYARIAGQGKGNPLLLYGHVDVVTTAGQEWEREPFGGEVVDGYIWGRGAVDMKGGIAMMLSAFLQVKADGLQLPFDLIFVALSDEEVGGAMGAKFMVEEHPELFEGVEHAIGEFGGFKLDIGGVEFYPIQVAEKEGCGLKITVKGPAGHGSMVQQGGAMGKAGEILGALDQHLLPVHITDSVRLMFEGMAKELPVYKRLLLRLAMVPALNQWAFDLLGDEWQKFKPLFRNTVNVTLINGGNAVNVLPSVINMNADVRMLPGFNADDVISEIRRQYSGDAEFEVVYSSPNPAGKPDMNLFPILEKELKNRYPGAKAIPFFMAGVTDARFFNRLGIQTYGFTPMTFPDGLSFTDLIHAPNERVLATSIDEGADIIISVINDYGSISSGQD